ncbi:ABC transporter ATP-binding protein [Halalkalibacter hemicellulosilyticus]|uniref:ABC transporter ATP-binding protein n=1 Tax=Halalkalibacter hemicellulosilyticusJCM 9152 TaxID=1236971 RepID=W4QH28_9BACI|nr:ABC transporter ATP-binding protein [Halalkalibacter hemicellulosilyticus]GAE31232.1 ABC transporter ATP-binding protein [Halalkalibacter hemicellulosilyticusJCM 9152]
MITFKNVSKSYDNKVALNEIHLELERNKIYGLLGRNGAGKTTMLQLLSGHTLPDKGTILINGEEPFNNKKALDQICFVSESGNFKQRLKIKHALKIASYYYPKWSNDVAIRLLDVFELNQNLNVKGLSKGMESALGIIIGLASRSPLTIFDEPYIGLDASLRYTFYDILLEEYELEPRTIILSTHLIDEVSDLFEEIILVKDQQILLHETAEQLKAKSLKVSGPKTLIQAFCKNKHVLYQSEMMGKQTAILYGDATITDAKKAGIEAEHCHIQELMVHLTTKKERKPYVS